MSLNKTKILLVTPSFTSGGAERVISQLANHFSTLPNLDVSLLCLISGDKFYKLQDNIKVVEPPFNHRQFNRAVFTFKIFRFLRNYLKTNKPDVVLSFGGRYNSFVLLAARGLTIRTFVSDRSRPDISYGKFLDLFNSIMYKRSTGIIAQTAVAKEIAFKRTGHKNIKVIGNPVRQIESANVPKENIILNAGRFIRSKNQLLLLDYFSAIQDGTWKLIFLGEGQYLEQAKLKARELGIEKFTVFAGNVTNIDDYYAMAKIFAFTSVSEGFPNALGEALSAGLPSISFNCNAGPADLIEDNVNGFLVDEMGHETYKKKLKLLMTDELLRNRFEKQSKIHIQKYAADKICAAYLNFICSG